MEQLKGYETGKKSGNAEKLGAVFIHGAGLNGNIWTDVAARLDRPALLLDGPHRHHAYEARRDLSFDDYAAALARKRRHGPRAGSSSSRTRSAARSR